MTSCKIVFNFDQQRERKISLSQLESLTEEEMEKVTLYRREQDSDKAYMNIILKGSSTYTNAMQVQETIYKFWSNSGKYSIMGGTGSEYGDSWFLTMESIEKLKKANRTVKRIVKEQEREGKVSQDLKILEELQKKFRESNPDFDDMMKDVLKPHPLLPPDPWKSPSPGWPLPEGPSIPNPYIPPSHPFPDPFKPSESSDEYIITTTTGTDYYNPYLTDSGHTNFHWTSSGIKVSYAAKSSCEVLPLLSKN